MDDEEEAWRDIEEIEEEYVFKPSEELRNLRKELDELKSRKMKELL
ncbi:MAG: hypothetical protein OH338_05120 [Candidatus Parvarchaeota archaeon]|nr:hypothetical protein [Candidatus Parvarchaeum tengchongense]